MVPLDHGEGRRAEEDRRQEPDDPDHLAVGHQAPDLLGYHRVLHAPLPYASIRPSQLKRAVAFYEEKAVRMLSR